MSSCVTRVTAFHDGHSLLGTVTATPHDLVVRMLEPFPGLSARRRLCLGTTEYASEGQLTLAGRMRAEELLADLYTLETWLRGALAALDRALAGARIDLTGLERAAERRLRPIADALQPLDEPEFAAARFALGRDLRAGLDPRRYQRRLSGLRRRRRAADVLEEELARGLAEAIVTALPEIGPAPLGCQASELLMPHLNRLLPRAGHREPRHRA